MQEGKTYIMRTKLLNLLMFFLACSTANLTGQTLKQYEKKATEAYSERNYSEALAYYKVLLEIDPDRTDALFYAGESGLKMRAFHVAEVMFERIPDTSKTGPFFLTDFRLANVKKGLKKYDEAIVYYQKFIENEHGVNDLLLKRAGEELDYCNWALDNLQNAAPVELVRYDTLINTYQTDFAPLKVDNTLFYTSAWFDGEDEDAKPVSKIYCSVGGGLGVPISENSETKGQHTSHIAFGKSGNRMYYTLCNDDELYVNEFQCQIYYRDKNEKGVWGAPYPLTKTINMPGYTATQPAIGWDAENEQEILYFSSNRPGGMGGMDIWSSVIIKDTICSTPVGLDSVNTEFDDMTPFFHAESNALYFSSRGHRSLGGLDIFRSEKKEKGWATPENLGYPINSSYDDLYYSFNSDLAQAHFASNRAEAMCDDPEKGCTCDDIFYFDVPVSLDVLTFNMLDSSQLNGVKVELRNLTDNTVETYQLNDEGNDFHFPLRLEKDYQIVATKEGWDDASVEISTKGIIYPTVFNEPLYLRPQIHLVVLTYDAISKLPLNGTAVRLDWETLGIDTSHINSEETNKCIFPLDFGHEYIITAAKQNYSTAFTSFSTEGYTTPTVITKELYLTPFVGLPLTLYFDNDKPRYVYRSDTTTKLTYAQTYERYLKRKNTFIYSFSAGLYGNPRQEARDTIRDFFTNEVQKGYEDLLKFTDILIDYLKGGNRIEIIVEGYASPLAPSDYNKKLTGRRVSSVINQLRTYRDGVLASYIDNKSLIILEAPKGEDASAEGVEDSPRKRRQSVYSPAASRERRVKILDIRRQEDIFSYTRKRTSK